MVPRRVQGGGLFLTEVVLGVAVVVVLRVPAGGAVATIATRRARRSAREPAMAVSRLKTRLSPLPGAPNVEELSLGTVKVLARG